MNKPFLESLQLRGFLSFGPESKPVQLTALNVLIGPNGVGKSNFIEAIEVLHATPTDLHSAIRLGGTPADWIWKGGNGSDSARIEAVIRRRSGAMRLKYGLEFCDTNGRFEVLDEYLDRAEKQDNERSYFEYYYRYNKGSPKIMAMKPAVKRSKILMARRLNVNPDGYDFRSSIFAQRKEPEVYPVLTATGKLFENIQLFRQWSFGRATPLRTPQSANLPSNSILPGLENLGLVLNDLEHGPHWNRFKALMCKFLPRFTRLTTKVSAGSVQIYLHEDGLSVPIPATRLSDGTLRFLALLAILLAPEACPLICIDEPELGLHPDAMSILADLLVEASAKTQIIVTTHSDALVSALTEHAESVLVCDMGRTGTELERLDSQKLAYWLKKYRLGEIWRLGKVGGNLW